MEKQELQTRSKCNHEITAAVRQMQNMAGKPSNTQHIKKQALHHWLDAMQTHCPNEANKKNEDHTQYQDITRIR